ncbi:MAG: hypothetical protein MJ180_02830, partial [Candidatus Gastranaerophilales bacterium]|nr:hypothetical protein [Candidatus Gastranaerophilales bacterium]
MKLKKTIFSFALATAVLLIYNSLDTVKAEDSTDNAVKTQYEISPFDNTSKLTVSEETKISKDTIISKLSISKSVINAPSNVETTILYKKSSTQEEIERKKEERDNLNSIYLKVLDVYKNENIGVILMFLN